MKDLMCKLFHGKHWKDYAYGFPTRWIKCHHCNKEWTMTWGWWGVKTKRINQ